MFSMYTFEINFATVINEFIFLLHYPAIIGRNEQPIEATNLAA